MAENETARVTVGNLHVFHDQLRAGEGEDCVMLGAFDHAVTQRGDRALPIDVNGLGARIEVGVLRAIPGKLAVLDFGGAADRQALSIAFEGVVREPAPRTGGHDDEPEGSAFTRRNPFPLKELLLIVSVAPLAAPTPALLLEK